MKSSHGGIRLQPRLRVMAGDDVPLGPGKADLLDQIDATSSLSRAAAALGMSYMRAWSLVKVMNRGFREPLVELTRGGAGGGGARLTGTGRTALDLYRKMEAASLKAAAPSWSKLAALLAEPPRISKPAARRFRTAGAPSK